MNRDSNPRTMNPGEYLEAWNVHVGYSEESKGQQPTRIKGTVEVSWPLPGGRNKCIGQEWDDQTQSLYGFIWNEHGEHTILKLDGTTEQVVVLFQGPNLEFEENKRITGLDLVNGELLYFTDYNSTPKKVNILKDNIRADKTTEQRLYFPYDNSYYSGLADDVLDRAFYAVIYQNGTIIASTQTGLNTGQSVATATGAQVRDFFSQVNVFAAGWALNPVLSQYFTAEACGRYVKLTANSPGPFHVECYYVDRYNQNPTAPTPGIWMNCLLWNKYGQLDKQTIDRAKWVAPKEPVFTLTNDPKRQYNLLSNKVFQFAVAYVYDDGEKTKMSPYSDVLVDEFGACSTGVNNNCAVLDFNSDRLIQNPGIIITGIPATSTGRYAPVVGVEIFVREGNSGDWRSIEVVDIAIWVYSKKYKFYNDTATTAVDDAYANALYDYVPIRSKSFETITDRGGNYRAVDGGIIEGYDNPCTQAKFTLSFEANRQKKTRDIVGRVRVVNPYADDNDYALNQPVHNLRDQHPGGVPGGGNPGIVYGGFGRLDIVKQVGTKYDQWLPEAGWPIYLAGTKYWAISRQIAAETTGPCGTFSPTLMNDNVYDSSQPGAAITPCNTSHVAAIRAAMNPQQVGVLATYTSTGVYSEFRIQDVAPGTYVLRVASHLCSHGDVLGRGATYDLDNGFNWHKTSTNIANMNNQAVTELVVVVPDTGTGDIQVGDIWISDNTDVRFTTIPVPEHASNVCGYLYDNEGQTNSTTDPLWNGTPIEKARVYLKVTDIAGLVLSSLPGYLTPLLPTGFWTALIGGGYPLLYDDLIDYLTPIGGAGLSAVRTDHNGYFYYTNTYGPFGANVKIAAVQVTGDPANTQGGYNPISGFTNFQVLSEFADDYYRGYVGSGSLVPASGALGGGQTTHNVVLYNHYQTPYQVAQTTIRGRCLTSAGYGVPGIAVVLGNGSTTVTDSQGYYEIIAWGDCMENLNRRIDNLYFVATGLCELAINQVTIAVNINTFQPNQNYSYQHWYYVTPDNAVAILSGQLSGRWKRGAWEAFGIEYRDAGGRQTYVVTNPLWKQYVPFYTEDLNLFDPVTYPTAGTFDLGNPVFRFDILGEVPIPQHGRFTEYAIVRTKNLLPQFTQWVAEDIIYAESWDNVNNVPVQSTYNDPQATEIYIDVSNFTTYNNQNSGASEGYLFSQGDRLRMIADHNGTYFQAYFDFPILAQRDKYIVIENVGNMPELEPGTFFEIYTPGLVTTNQIYYEIPGAMYPINDPYGNPAHSVTSGTLRAGNCWYRPRQITADTSVYTYFVEDESVSDVYPSNCERIGRYNIEDANAKQLTRPTALRVSNPYLPGTRANGFSSIEGLNIKELDRSYGLINKLVKTGDTLLCICANSRTVAIYIGQAVIRDTQGQAVLAISDDILGNFRPLEYHAGTVNPESVVEQDGDVYWADLNTGEWMRHSSNALFPISSYGLKTYASEISAKLRNTDDPVMPATFDRFFGEMILYVPGYNTVRGEIDYEVKGRGVAFFGPYDGWTTFYDMRPDMLGKFRQTFVSFVEGRVLIHNRGNYGEIDGVVYPSKIIPVAAQEPSKVKTWLALAEESTSVWTAVATNDRGQETRMDTPAFREFEGVWKATLRRDVNTPNVANPLLSGRELKSEVLIVELSNSDNDSTTIFALDVLFNISQRTDR